MNASLYLFKSAIRQNWANELWLDVCCSGEMMETSKTDRLSQVCLQLSGAIVNQKQWRPALQQLADAFGGNFATFELIDKRTGRHIQHHDSSDLEIQESYLRHFMPRNPRIAFGNSPHAPQILHDNAFLTEAAMNRHEFYADFLTLFDLRYFLSFKAYETSNNVGVFTIQRSYRYGPAEQDDLVALQHIAPTLAQVADLQVHYEQHFTRLLDLQSMLDSTGDGVLLLDQAGYICEMNAKATDILALNDGLGVSKGKLVSPLGHAQRKLDQLIGIGELSGDPILTRVLVPRLSGLLPFQVRRQQVPAMNDNFSHSKGASIVFIRDPSDKQSVSIVELVDYFGLTEKEASIALLIASGKTAQEVSSLFKVSLPTVRTHVQRIMQKMSIHRQLDIARIIGRLM